MSNTAHHPPHLGFDSWALADSYKPELLLGQLNWIMNDPERRNSAIERMQPILGFNALLIAFDQDMHTRKVRRSIQLNFYENESSQAQEADSYIEKPHGHAKDAVATWYAPSGVSQVITRLNVLRSDESPLEGDDTVKRLVLANCIEGTVDGRRSRYRPIILGETSVGILSRSWVTNGGRTFFSSTEVHSIGTEFLGANEVAISVHYKGPVEPPSYNTIEGLMKYKKLTREQAEKVLAIRETQKGYQSPITMMYPEIGRFNAEELRNYPKNTERKKAEDLLEKGRALVAKFCEV